MPIWDMEAFDHAIVAARAYLGLSRTAAAGEDDSPNRIEVASQMELELESSALWLGGERKEGQVVLTTASAR